MSFNINEFNSRINAVGGLQKASLFYVEIAPPPWLFKSGGSFLSGLANLGSALNNTNLRFLCSSASLPGVSALFADTRRQNYGTIERVAYGAVLPNVDCVFYVDNANTVLRFFHKWMQNIVQFNTDGSDMSATSTGAYPFEVGYYDDYVTTVTIYFVDETAGFGIRSVKLIEAYPISLGDVSLNWASTDDVATVAAAFSYRSFSTSWLEKPGGSTGLDRLFSALDQFQQIRTSVSTVGSLRAPTSIADAVNVVNNVGLVSSALR